jgi:hypothetical protein
MGVASSSADTVGVPLTIGHGLSPGAAEALVRQLDHRTGDVVGTHGSWR